MVKQIRILEKARRTMPLPSEVVTAAIDPLEVAGQP